MASPLLEIRGLSVSFEKDGDRVCAVDGVSLTIEMGRTVALVGESGCGKSVTALSILRLLPQPPANVDGAILFHEPIPGPDRPAQTQDILRLSDRELRRIRGGRIAMVFQEPMSSLNPAYSVGEQVCEVVTLHTDRRGRAAWDRAVELLERVGIPDPARRAREYPHRLSGGMRQRAMIAQALAGRPALLIADEPTTALDVTVQRQILDLLRFIQADVGLGMLLITHDLGVVAEVADEVAVMYAGRIVEQAATDELLSNPRHPYTRALLRCSPSLRTVDARLEVVPGTVPRAGNYPCGCRFHPRCGLTRGLAAEAPSERIVVGDHPVLRRCVASTNDPGIHWPPLREVAPRHLAACPEATRQAQA